MTQPVNDPWAAASATPAPVAPAQPAYSAPAATGQVNPLPFDTANLFGRPSDFGGGTFTPTAPMESLVGRTVIYIPRTFNPAAPNPFATDASNATRPQWTADMYVVDGGELRFFYEQKADPNATPPRVAGTVEHVHENASPQTPYTVLNAWVSQSAFVTKLTRASERRQFLVGTPVRGAQKRQRDAGQTDESVRQAHAAWVARGKAGAEPKFVWLLADTTPEGMSAVMAWWDAHKDSIKI